MPPGVPVACVGLDNPRNAAILAAQILGRKGHAGGGGMGRIGVDTAMPPLGII